MICVTLSNAQITKKRLELGEVKSIYNNSNYSIYFKANDKQEVNVEALTEIFTSQDYGWEWHVDDYR